jgi:uncharacterized membrane protein
MSLLFTLLIAVACIGGYFYSGQAEKIAKMAEKVNEHRAQQIQNLLKHRTEILIAGIISTILFLIIFIWVCRKRKSISVAAGVIEVTGKFVSTHSSLFVVMLICFVLQLATIAGCGLGLIMIHTSGEVKSAKETEGAPFHQYKYDMLKWVEVIAFIIGFYWCVSFWNNLCDFAVARSAVDYYFNIKSGALGNLCSSLFKHFGSIAYGSLVLLPNSITKMIFGPIHAVISDDKENKCQKFLRKVCCLCMVPYEKCCLRMDDNAFAMIHLTKLNFCPSARKEFYLKRRVEEKVGNASFIGFLYSMLGRIGIASFTAWISFMVFSKVEYFHEQIKNVFVPVVVSSFSLIFRPSS